MNNRATKVLIGCIIITSFSLGAYSCMPVYMVPLSQALNASIGQISLLFTFAGCASIVTSFLLGNLLKRIKVRLLISIAAVCQLSFFVCVYLAENVALIYAGSLLFGFSTVIAGFGVAQTLIAWWYQSGVAKRMSFLTMGMGLLTFVLSPVSATLIENVGVRSTALIQGFVNFAVILLCDFFLISEHPRNYGVTQEQSAQSASVPSAAGLSAKEAMKTPAFWLVLLAIVLMNVAFTGFSNNASAFYQTIGLSAVNASLCISICSAAKLVWAPVFGTITDRHGPAIATAICGLAVTAVFFGATLLSGFAGAVVIAVIVAGATFCGILGSAAYPRMFGTKDAGTLIGYANAGASLGAMIGAPVAGFIYDATNSYKPYLIVAGFMAALCVVLTVVGTKSKKGR